MKNWPGWIKKRLSLEVILRVVADAVLVNVGMVGALVVRLMWIIATTPAYVDVDVRDLFWLNLTYYRDTGWLITLLCLIIFSIMGFYTYGRFYRGKFKILIIAQAVSLAYLIFGLLSFLSQGTLLGFLRDWLKFPTVTLVLAWILTAVLLIVARVWTALWRNMSRMEKKLLDRPEERKIRHVLVIGGAGYIGSALLPRLLDKGYKVRVLDLLIYGIDPIKPWLSHPNLEVIQADFRQIDKVVEAMKDIDAVIHLGGLVGDPACAVDEDLTIDINLIATQMIAEVAKGSGVGHFIFASTCSVYGAGGEILDERSELNPVSLYARSKIASEKVLFKMVDEHFAPVILRFGTVYGLSGRTRFDLVINLLTAKALVDHEITIFGGDQWRPFLHVDDAARSIMAVLGAPLNVVRNQVFNVGSNEQNYTIWQVGEIIHHLVPGSELVNKGNGGDRRDYRVNFNKIRKTLGFVPKWSVEQGVVQVVQAIEKGHVGDYRDAKYSNVKFLTEEGFFRLNRHENGWAYQLLYEKATGQDVMVDM